MKLQLKDKGRYGTGCSDEIGRCEICGQPVASSAKLCTRCRDLEARQRIRSGAGQKRSLQLWLPILLALLLVVLLRWLGTKNSLTATEAENRPAAPSTDARSAAAAGQGASQTTDTGAQNHRHGAGGSLTTETISCPVCSGRGRLDYDTSRSRTRTYECPVCNGAGERVRRFQTDKWQLCGTCRGMGSLAQEDDLFRTRNRITSTQCPICNGKGLVTRDIPSQD